MTDEPIDIGNELDEILYGGVRVPVSGEEMRPGEMFFVAENTILVHEWESLVTKPIKFGEIREGVYFLTTFKGKVNNKDELGAVTVAMDITSVMALIKTYRAHVMKLPLEHRTTE